MIKLLTTLILILSFNLSFGQDLSKEQQAFVSKFIGYVKNKDKDRLAVIVSYPLTRQYPVPSIKNKLEFVERYDELFDDKLTKLITSSNPAKDWSEVGWRGITMGAGDVWLNESGSIIAINYESVAAIKHKNDLIAKDRNSLFESLKKFAEPICILETIKFRIRIDKMAGGMYRYASWNIKSKMSDKPDLVIENGQYISEGSGGNHTYKFKKGDYIYDCDIIIIGEEAYPPAKLTVTKGDKELFSQNANIVEY